MVHKLARFAEQAPVNLTLGLKSWMLLWIAVRYRTALKLIWEASRREGLWLWGHMLLWHIAIGAVGRIKSGVIHGWRCPKRRCQGCRRPAKPLARNTRGSSRRQIVEPMIEFDEWSGPANGHHERLSEGFPGVPAGHGGMREA